MNNANHLKSAYKSICDNNIANNSIAIIKSGHRIGQIDTDDSLFKFYQVMSKSDILVIISCPNLKLPQIMLEEIANDMSENSHIRYDIRVNENKILSTHYLVFRHADSFGSFLRAFVFFVFLRFEKCVSRILKAFQINWNGILLKAVSRFQRICNKFVIFIESTLIAPKIVINTKLNGYILTNRIKAIPELVFPANLHVALTKSCNLNCIMCPYHSRELRKQHTTNYFSNGVRLSETLLKRIIDEAGTYRSHLSFGQYDEPFIYNDFVGWVVKAKKAGCAVSITTNGTMLNNKAAEMLVSTGVDHISFSIDAASQNTYQTIRNDDFDLPIKNIRNLVWLRDRNRCKTKLRACLVVQEQNKHELDLFYDLGIELGLDMVSFYNISTYNNGIWQNKNLNFEINETSSEDRPVCSQLYDQIAIYPDGNVALCCLTTMYLGYRDDVPYVGNLKDSSIYDLWHSESYRRIRVEAFQGRFDNSICHDCTIWHNFKNRYTVNTRGHKVYQNAYETLIHLR